MKTTGSVAALFFLLGFLSVGPAHAGGGPLGIDHVLSYDDSGIWKRSNQQALLYTLIGGEVAGAVWLGGEHRLGKTFWQAIDSSAIGGISSEALKHVFTRSRPDQSSDPNLWFQGKGHYSFPSGEVTAVTAITTPFVFEYAHEYPAVYALLLLPAYDSVARMKVQAHWQTDVLAGVALGAGTGYFAHTRDSPIILGMLPGGFIVGLHKQW
ncbi:MAG TPA: phosphatase PAP2 family protein [Casimicrobiaceae bacterium]|nr:phosphatase PAP2 family protein [Casimicrobiaceae bacterium]